MDEIRISGYSAEHCQAVIDLVLGIQREEFVLPITLKGQPDLEDIEGFFMKNGNFWVAIGDGRVIGTLGIFGIGGGNAALRKMFVEKAYRGKGVSGKLLNALLEWAKRGGYRSVYLGTTPLSLAAHRFYEKNGFIEIASMELPAGFPVMEVDKKFYQYDL